MAAGHNYLNHEKGLWSWLTTLDHKRIGILYMITVLTFFFIGGVFAMLIRAELFSPGATFMDGATYNQMMTFHGAIMVFMVIIPGIPGLFRKYDFASSHRGQGCGIPSVESFKLVLFNYWGCNCFCFPLGQWFGYGLDVLHSL